MFLRPLWVMYPKSLLFRRKLLDERHTYCKLTRARLTKEGCIPVFVTAETIEGGGELPFPPSVCADAELPASPPPLLMQYRKVEGEGR